MPAAARLAHQKETVPMRTGPTSPNSGFDAHHGHRRVRAKIQEWLLTAAHIEQLMTHPPRVPRARSDWAMPCFLVAQAHPQGPSLEQEVALRGERAPSSEGTVQPQHPLPLAPGLLPGEDLFLPEQVSNDVINQGDGRV